MAAETRNLNNKQIRDSLAAAGMTQKDLAAKMDVTAQAVTNWLSGKDFPRPPKLLKLGLLLNLAADQLVQSDQSTRPVVAFRKKAGSKTTQAHIERAEHVGMLLRPLVPYFKNQSHIRPSFRSSHHDAYTISEAALQTRARLGVGDKANIKYADLIGEFNCCGAALVPVMWGKKEKHKNGLHIHLPAEEFTFIFLNIDTRMEDFKFWMAHELAHVYTPDLAGTNEGEDFADAFAGSLLFSSAMARLAYNKIKKCRNTGEQANALLDVASKHLISPLTVYKQIEIHIGQSELPPLGISNILVNQTRNKNSGSWISESLFGGRPPTALKYVQLCSEKFESEFFDAYSRMLTERDVGSGYLQQVLSITHAEARELHQVLSNENSSSS